MFSQGEKYFKTSEKKPVPARENFMLPLKNLLNNPCKIISYRGKPMKIQHVKKAPLVEKKISVKLINFYPVQIKFQSEKKRTVRTATIRRQLRFDPASLLDSFVVDSGHLVI